MLENGLYERYVPEKAFDSVNHVRCYRGGDQILKRDVLLLIWEEKEGQPTITPPRTEGMTLQLLDVGKKEKENYVVYEYIPGLPLSQAVEENKLNIREALGLIIHIVEMMIVFGEEGRCKPLLLQENFWLTEKGEIKILDFWDDCAERGQEITALYRLFHQLIFGKVHLKLPSRQLVEEISLSYQGNPYVIRKTLKALLHKEEKNEVVFTLTFLKQVHTDFTSLYHYIKSTQNKSLDLNVELEKVEPKPKLKPKPTKQKQTADRKVNKKKVGRWIGIGLLLLGVLFGGKGLYSMITESLNKQPPTPFQIEVPKVTGLSLEEADQVLKEKGVSYQYFYKKSFFFSFFRESGTVIKQHPSSGEYMYRSDLIELWVKE